MCPIFASTEADKCGWGNGERTPVHQRNRRRWKHQKYTTAIFSWQACTRTHTHTWTCLINITNTCGLKHMRTGLLCKNDLGLWRLTVFNDRMYGRMAAIVAIFHYLGYVSYSCDIFTGPKRWFVCDNGQQNEATIKFVQMWVTGHLCGEVKIPRINRLVFFLSTLRPLEPKLCEACPFAFIRSGIRWRLTCQNGWRLQHPGTEMTIMNN